MAPRDAAACVPLIPGGPAGMETLLKHVSPEEIPDTEDLVSAADLPRHLDSLGATGYSLVAVGDIMLAERADVPILEHGVDYLFDGVRPLLSRAPVVFGNLEGPLAPPSWKMPRYHSYAVPPERAAALARAGINLVSLANNHLMDCGRRGVLRTLRALARAEVSALGGGADRDTAHTPVVREAGGVKIGFLGYYWNRRCAARQTLPGGAMDNREAMESDIKRLKARVDRVVVAFHWGIPYEREPLAEDRDKARFAIDCGVDLVIGHHPHVIQPFEIHRGRAIFYSIGNFAFGSGNSRAEGLALAVRFDRRETTIDVFPLYVKNRDPRVDYQPKLLRGRASRRVLSLLAGLSANDAAALEVRDGYGPLRLV